MAWALDEAFGPGGVGGVEDVPARGVGLRGEAVVDGRRGHQADPGVAVLVVVVGEELAAEGARLVDRGEAAGKAGRYLSVLKCASE